MSKPRAISSIYLYNMLQDFRHLLIFDLRKPQNYEQYYIRDSFNVNEQTPKEMIETVIETAEFKATQKQKKYKQLKRVRRYFFVSDQKLKEEDKQVQQLLKSLQKNKSADDKVYMLDGGMEAFAKKYPFVCLTKDKNQLVLKLKEEGKQEQSDKILLYPYCKFPSEIIADKLYLGNVYSSNSEKQLEDMGINTLIDFIEYNEEEKIPEFKSNSDKYHFMHLPFNSEVPANIDFDVIMYEIDKLVEKGKTLFYCRDGEVISPAFAIAYLMWKCKLDINMATLKVCQAISRVEICKWIYTQLLVYKPKK